MIGRSVAILVPPGGCSSRTGCARASRPAAAPSDTRPGASARTAAWSMCSATASPTLDAAGNVVGLSVIVQDITERLGSRRMLEASQHQLAVAQRIAGVGSFEFDIGDWADELVGGVPPHHGSRRDDRAVQRLVLIDDSPRRSSRDGRDVGPTWPSAASPPTSPTASSEATGRSATSAATPRPNSARTAPSSASSARCRTTPIEIEAERVAAKPKPASRPPSSRPASAPASSTSTESRSGSTRPAAPSWGGREAELINRSWETYHHPDELPVGQAMAARGLAGQRQLQRRAALHPTRTAAWCGPRCT